jgi:hypothetical protein
VCNRILNAEFKGDKYFVEEVETQLREKPLNNYSPSMSQKYKGK